MDDKHAYLILAHANPNQVRTLLKLSDDLRNDIYLHIDSKAGFGYEEFQDCCNKSNIHFIEPRIAVHWGGFSILRAELALLKVSLPGNYSYYHLLSGMDLPIKSQNEIHDFFNANKGKEFLNLWQIKGQTLSRFHYYTPFPEGGRFFLTNYLNNIVKGFQILIGCKINRDVEFHYGSQWFSITHGLARYVVEQEEWLTRTFRHTSTCDEVFMATMAFRSPYRENIFDKTEYADNSCFDNISNMRLIDWSRGKSVRHPWVFTSKDYDMLMTAPHLWARKFDEKVDVEIIERIARTLQR